MKKRSIISSKSVAAVKAPENSTLSLDENKQKQDNVNNSENIGAINNESNEKCTVKSSKDLEITDVSNVCSSAVLKEHTKLENNLSINNLSTNTHISNVRNAELLTVHNEENLKEAASDSKKIISINSCELNKLDNADNNILSINSANAKSEKISTNTIVSKSNDDSLGNKMVDKRIKNNNSLKRSHVELNDNPNYVDLVKSGNSKDSSSYKGIIAHKSKNKNSELVKVIENKSASNISKVTEKVTNTSLIQNQNNSSNVKNSVEVTNEGHDTNNDTNVNNSNNESGTKNVDTVVPKRKRIKKIINTVPDRAGECEQGRKYLI